MHFQRSTHPEMASATPETSDLRLVQHCGRADQRLEGGFIDVITLMDIDGAPDLAFQAGVEHACRVSQRSAFSKGQLHLALVGLAGADDAALGPDRNVPLPLFDRLGGRLPNQRAHTGKRLAAPVVQAFDFGVYALRRGLVLVACALFHGCPSGRLTSSAIKTCRPAGV